MFTPQDADALTGHGAVVRGAAGKQAERQPAEHVVFDRQVRQLVAHGRIVVEPADVRLRLLAVGDELVQVPAGNGRIVRADAAWTAPADRTPDLPATVLLTDAVLDR